MIDKEKNKVQELKPEIIEKKNEIIEEAKKIILFSVEGLFGKEALNRVYNIINTIRIDRDSTTLYIAYMDFEKNSIFFGERFFKLIKNQFIAETIFIIMHEYAHVFSKLLFQMKKDDAMDNFYSSAYSEINVVVEEAMANIFAEVCFSYYIQNGEKLKCISKRKMDELIRNNGYHEDTSYIDEGCFTRSIMYALQNKNMDIEALREYYFGFKSEFVNICERTLGKNIRGILIRDLGKTSINNTEPYLPQATRELRNILMDFFDFPMDEKDIKSQRRKW